MLQEVAVRLGTMGNRGLADALAESLAHPLVRGPVMLLFVAAIGVGNAACEGGNLVGAALGAGCPPDRGCDNRQAPAAARISPRPVRAARRTGAGRSRQVLRRAWGQPSGTPDPSGVS